MNNKQDNAQALNLDEMQNLVHDHAECLEFAHTLIRIAEQGSAKELAAGIQAVRLYNIEELEPHLQHEEQVILRPLIQNHPEHMQLCITIGKEHGLLRTMAEDIKLESAQQDLADFGRLLLSHTKLEDESLFPLVASLFTERQMADIKNFMPLTRHIVEQAPPLNDLNSASTDDQKWLSDVEKYFGQSSVSGANIVLFARFNPELSQQMADHFSLDYFDFQHEVMKPLGQAAETMNFDQLDKVLQDRAEQSGFILHNVEALLCVKSASERRHWLSSILNADWANRIVLPIMVFHEDVPEDHVDVCDLELHKLPRQKTESYSGGYEKLKFAVEQRE